LRWIERRAAKIGLLAGSLVVALLVAELALRAIGYYQMVAIYYDPLTGVGLIPGAHGIQNDEGRAWVQINSHGFRDAPRSIEKPAGTYRIAVLGDSFVQASEVELQDTFVARLEASLNGCGASGGKRVEVLNFGVRSFGQAQEAILLREVVWKYQPDLVLLAFFPGNDVMNASRELDGDFYKPYYRLVDGRLSLDSSYTDAVRHRRGTLADFWYQTVLQRSRLAQLIHHARRTAIQARSGSGGPAAAMNEWEVYPQMYREPAEKSWRDAWDVTEALFTDIKRDTDDHRVPFVVVEVTNGIDVYPGKAERGRLQRQFGLDDPSYPERRMAALGARAGFPVIPLRETFARYADEHQAFLHGFEVHPGHGHWNAQGHRLAAEVLSSQFCGPLRGLIH